MQVLKNRSHVLFLSLLLLVAALPGCTKQKDYQLYHKFPNHSWYRFNILSFEIPVKQEPKPVDIYLFAVHTKDYPYDNLDFNMVLNTPSGEERINEYHIPIKRKDGGFAGKFTADSCVATIALKKEFSLTQEGILKIEIENLVPRIETPGLLGIGIRIHRPE